MKKNAFGNFVLACTQQISYKLLPLLAVVIFSANGWAEETSSNSEVSATELSGNTDNWKKTAPPPKAHCVEGIPPVIEGKVGYFFYSSSKLRKIYKSGGVDVQLTGSYPIWKWLQVYASAEYFQKSGKLLHSGRETTIWQVPLSLGLQPVIRISQKIHYYITLGPRYIFVHQHNHSPYLDKVVKDSGYGGFVNTGFHFWPRNHFVVDIFGEYSYKRMSFHSHKTHVYANTQQVGGFTFGAGLGYSF